VGQDDASASEQPQRGRVCGICRLYKNADAFHVNRYNGRLHTYCRECLRKKLRTLPDHNTPEKKRAAHLKRLYGITVADYDALVVAQNGVCAICRQQPNTVRRPKGYGRGGGDMVGLVVDHDHTTGKVRGLLCINCNRALGYVHDDVALLDATASYLRAHQAADAPAPQRVKGA
jgi:hypothetical protein